MAEIKKNCSGCKKEQEGKCSSAGEVAPELCGAGLALGAINEMEEEQAEKESCCDVNAEEIEAFLRKCDEMDKDPLEVISHIAKKEGLSLNGSRRDNDDPEEGSSYKRKLRDFLLAVIKAIVLAAISNAVDDHGIGSILSSIINLRREREAEASCVGRSIDAEDDEPMVKVRRVRPMPVFSKVLYRVSRF